MAILEVHQLKEADTYKDVVRIHQSMRGAIGEGQVCRIYANGRSCLTSLRGLPDEESGYIRIDEITRKKLGELILFKKYDFSLVTVGVIQNFLWACRASEPGPRVAAIVAAWSFVLAVVSLLFALLKG